MSQNGLGPAQDQGRQAPQGRQTGQEREAMTKSDKKLLECLRRADEALYRLWKELPLIGEFNNALNRLQKEYIHPEIKRIQGEGRD